MITYCATIDERRQYIKQNFRWHSDSDLAGMFRVSETTIKMDRVNLRIRRSPKFSSEQMIPREKVASLLEYYANGWTVASAARTLFIPLRLATLIVETIPRFKQRGYDTITVVVESKINFDT